MKQYCKYCGHVAYKQDKNSGKEVYRCLALDIELFPASKVSRANHCKRFDMCGYDVKTGREYVPNEERGKAVTLDGQLML